MIKTIKVFGDKYSVRTTYDIDDFGIGLYGYEIYDENKNFIKYVSGIKNFKKLKDYIKIIFYKNFIKNFE